MIAVPSLASPKVMGFEKSHLGQGKSNSAESRSNMTSSAPFVNLLHDLLSPLNACGNQLVSPWASLRTSKQIVSRLHVQARQNSCHHTDNTFAAFIHGHESSSFAVCSLYWGQSAFSTGPIKRGDQMKTLAARQGKTLTSEEGRPLMATIGRREMLLLLIGLDACASSKPHVIQFGHGCRSPRTSSVSVVLALDKRRSRRHSGGDRKSEHGATGGNGLGKDSLQGLRLLYAARL
jgi:hypothetical protein